MRKELYVNGEKLIMEKDTLGNKTFFRTYPDGREFGVKTYDEHLIDKTLQMLWPLQNLKDILGMEESPGPIHYLLADMLTTLGLKMETLCQMIEEECGRIEVHECYDVVPGVAEGTILSVSHKNA
jgi:hypothetical protein